jgi:putative MATE family efflux protein
MSAAAAKFTQGPLIRHILVMSATSSIGLMAIFLVDVINILYISWLGDPVATAAVGYAGAVLFFSTGIAIGLSIATSALVSRAMGARDPARARQAATNGLVAGTVFGVALHLVALAFLGPIIAALGATGETARQTERFLQVSLAAQPLLLIGIMGTAILRGRGDAKRGMMPTVWGAVALAVVDPVFIFWLDGGLMGAAWAGVISRAVIAGTAIWPILRHHGGFDRPTLPGLRADLVPIFAIAGPAMLTQLATPLGQAIVTRLVAVHGEAAVAGMAIAGRLTPVAFGIIFALSGAIGPIIGQNYGAGRIDRVRAAFWQATGVATAIVVVMSGLLFVLRGPIADLFQAEGLTRDLLLLFCGPLALMFVFNGWIFVSNAACNNLGAPMQSTAVNWGRHTLGTLPFAVVMGGWWGAEGVLIGQAVGGILFGVLAIWMALRVIDRLPQHKPQAMDA